MTIAAFSLLHVLVFVYWLGGDLGAFYTSRYLTADGVPADRRLFAAKIVGDVDMAPRTSLILALPTGLALAQSKGWLDWGWPIVGAVATAALGWLVLAWHLHLNHGAGDLWKKVDMALRWGLAATLTLGGLGSVAGIVPLPIFLGIKALALAGCIGLGLLIRRTLQPLFPALGQLASAADTTQAEQTIQNTLNRARPQVKGIWTLLLVAAFFGLWTPTSF
ncbi:MAG: hypothetical protein HRU11_00060 [Parvularculaceae bacterium]|nr:hypothetical protein [Parvularculaceae bacterium]